MAKTFDAIATTTLGSAASSITFSSIPSTYTSLEIRGNGIAGGDGGMDFQLNGDSGSNYSYTYIYGEGSSTVSGRNTNGTRGSGGRVGVYGSTAIFYLENYSNTNTYKTILSRGGNADVLAILIVSLWRNTSAINSITFTKGGGGNFSAGSTFTLYGIKAA